MIEIPLILLGVAFLGMATIVVRHGREIYSFAHTVDQLHVPRQTVRHQFIAVIRDGEHFLRERVVPILYWIGARFFSSIEQGSKYIAHAARRFKITMHKKSVTPRESLYWSEMRDWKQKEVEKKNGDK